MTCVCGRLRNGAEMIVEVTPEQRAALLKAWLDRVASGYSKETTRFLLGTGDPFANPVGAELRNTLATIIEALAEDRPLEDLDPVLDRFIRIRAVQEFPPGRRGGVHSGSQEPRP